MKCLLACSAALLLVSATVRSETPPRYVRWFDSGLGGPLEVPEAIRRSPDFAQLGDEEEETPRGVRVDLNEDGSEEYILIGSGKSCGTGGCPYKLFDGRSHQILGTLFGDPLILTDARINGFTVLCMYSHMSAGSGSYNTYVFDGHTYEPVSSLSLRTDSLDDLFADLRKLPKLTAGSKSSSGGGGDASKQPAPRGSGEDTH